MLNLLLLRRQGSHFHPFLWSICLSVCVILIAFQPTTSNSSNKSPESRSIQIHNDSGHRIEVHWVHVTTGELVLQTTPHIYAGATFKLDSFRTHKFQVREIPAMKSGQCGGGSSDKTCKVAYFTVNDNHDQVIFVNRGLEIEHTDNKVIAKRSATEMINDCQSRALTEISTTSSSSQMLSTDSASKLVQDMAKCVESGVSAELVRSNEEIAFQTKVRKGMGELLENYTCADDDLPSTEPLKTQWWYYKGINRQVEIMHDRPSSRIHVVKNIISDTECQAMEQAAKPKLHKATVADGSGGSELSDQRKAMQAGITVPWNLENRGNHIAAVSRKVYEYVNHVLGLNITEHGQEDLMSIQYFGRGPNDESPDRYKPHCDGDCGGMDFKVGTRVATMVMYCTIPERGGATNFRNANLHIIPERGSGTFFSYIDTDTMKMDTGFTEHSGCPVIEGEKKIVTQWIRLGVDKENPWSSFNTLGIKRSDAAKQ